VNEAKKKLTRTSENFVNERGSRRRCWSDVAGVRSRWRKTVARRDLVGVVARRRRGGRAEARGRLHGGSCRDARAVAGRLQGRGAKQSRWWSGSRRGGFVQGQRWQAGRQICEKEEKGVV